MRKLVCLALLAACELQPPPKEQPAPPPAAASTPAPAPAPAKPVEEPRIEVSAPCLDVATKIVQVFIDNAADAGQKSVYEQARANMTRKTAEACTTQGWSDQARSCYAAARTPADIKACELKFPPSAGSSSPGPVGAGVAPRRPESGPASGNPKGFTPPPMQPAPAPGAQPVQ